MNGAPPVKRCEGGVYRPYTHTLPFKPTYLLGFVSSLVRSTRRKQQQVLVSRFFFFFSFVVKLVPSRLLLTFSFDELTPSSESMSQIGILGDKRSFSFDGVEVAVRSDYFLSFFAEVFQR